MRSLPITPLMVLFLIGLGGYLGCDPNSIPLPPDSSTPAGTSTTYPSSVGTSAPSSASSSAASSSPNSATTSSSIPVSTRSNSGGAITMPDRQPSTLLIGSFNMQRLGPSKLGNSWVMDKFAAIIRRFDVIALQEITSKDQRTVPQLLEHVNADGSNYSYTISPRIGREATGYYEQYAFVYDAKRVRSGDQFSYVVQDDDDVLHREPFVGRFETITTGQPFTFTLVNIHTDPGEIAYEIDVLADVYINVRQFEYPEDDVILLGDLNASPEQFQKLGQIPGFEPVIVGIPTNTRKNKIYDNIVFDRQAGREFTGRAGVLDMEQMFRVEMTDALRISDHMPIWAEFSITEQTGGYTASYDGAQLVR